MTAGTTAELRRPESDNPVSSFEVGIMTVKGTWCGICIKFSLYDRTSKITHWSLSANQALIKALHEYCEHLGANAFMFRAKADPRLVESLPARHPYHTLLAEVPALSEVEIGTASRGTGIDKAIFSFRGSTLELRPEFNDGHTESIYLHEYTALSLLGYLEEYVEAAKVLTGPAAGNA